MALGLILAVREPHGPRRPSSAITPAGTKLPPASWRYLFVTALFGIGNSTNAFQILRLKDTGTSFARTILVYTCFNLVAAVASYPTGAADRLGLKPVLLGSLAVFTLAYVGFAAGLAVLMLVPLFVGYGAYRTVGKAFAADLVPANLRATGIGWLAAVLGLSSFLASTFDDWLWSAVSPGVTLAYGAACAGTRGGSHDPAARTASHRGSGSRGSPLLTMCSLSRGPESTGQLVETSVGTTG